MKEIIDALRKALKPFAGLATPEELAHWDESHFGSSSVLIDTEDIRNAQAALDLVVCGLCRQTVPKGTMHDSLTQPQHLPLLGPEQE